MNKNFSFTQCAIVLLACTAIVSTAILLYVRQLTNTLESETLQILREFANQDVQHIEQQVSNDLSLLGAIATAMSILPDPTLENMTQLLNTERTQHLFKNMELASTSGITYLDDGKILNLSQEPHFQLALSGKAQISQRVEDLLDGQNILVEAVPVKNKDKVIGVLMGTRSTAEFGKMLDMQSFGGEGYSLLVDADGNKVVESFHKNAVSGLYNIFDMPDDPDHQLRAQVLKDFKAHKSGIVRYQSSKRGVLYVSYQPININNWYLIAVVPEKHIAKVTETFITLLPVLCVLIAIAAFILGGYMSYAWPVLRKEWSTPNEQ